MDTYAYALLYKAYNINHFHERLRKWPPYFSLHFVTFDEALKEIFFSSLHYTVFILISE